LCETVIGRIVKETILLCITEIHTTKAANDCSPCDDSYEEIYRESSF
jgi:hypothetical protein